ncbi:MAG: type II toxin-antitoxin system HipA family toxin YjjJ [Gammaproteobacteria bacterium]
MPADRQSQLITRLERGVAASTELEAALDLSQTAVSRLLRELISDGQIIRLGTTRGARYGLLRPIGNIGTQWELRRIDASGNVQLMGRLHALAAGEYAFAPSTRIHFAWGGVTEGIPYFLQDPHPGGFLGRAVPLRYPELGLPQRVIDWNDDHYLQYLTRRGADTVGDLILGDESFNEYVELQKRRTPIALDARVAEFPRLAKEVMGGGLPGSSAHGEHPKFTVLLRRGDDCQHALVKFSPPVTTAVGQRWSDLLVAEHLAHEVLSGSGMPAARSEIHQFERVTFLQMDRFDRSGLNGRVGVTSLLSIDTTQYGMLDNWIASAMRLHRDRRIDAQTLDMTRLVYTFGGLIANTDRHFGNLAMFDRYDGQFRLAPVYDMLPMLFAPQNDEIIARVFQPADPTAETMAVYRHARELAERYWQLLSTDTRVSADFRAIAETCGNTLAALPRTGAYAYAENAAPGTGQ